MAHLNKFKAFISIKPPTYSQNRPFGKYIPKEQTSRAIRQRFLDYFINDHNHTFVRSSPVVPFCDPTVPFVNAGMNQFKGVFLGTKEPPYKRVANSQKCVRIGGKHNDLSVVGTDGYHHTFFEMLGNWSFGECDKKAACKLSWELLTEIYGINPALLYVTYFKGDESLALKADLECKEIWRDIGVAEDRILPYGIRDNFWEMGLTGPCGPCTEIHIDRLGTTNRAKFVNKGLPDLTELWNVVFIQYNKDGNGGIGALKQKHVDTGMGFERLVAVMQGKISSYDTDLFEPVLNAIGKICKEVPPYEGKFGEKDWNSLDASYRVIADHSRTITVCLADGMIPEQNQKLRRLIRKVFRLSETTFKRESGLLKELSNYVVESLGSVYPEMERNFTTIQQIIDYEEEVYNSLKSTAAEDWKILTKHNPDLADLDVTEMPGLIKAFRDIQKTSTDTITPKLAFKLYDTHGLDEEIISTLATAMKLKFNVEDFQKELGDAKKRSKSKTAAGSKNSLQLEEIKNKIQSTIDHFKYEYKRENSGYVFPDLNVEIIAILKKGNFIEKIEPNTPCTLILNKTNFYAEAGGQQGDSGVITLKNGDFIVQQTEFLHNYVLHQGFFKSASSLKVGDHGVAKVAEKRRLNTMKNHTGVHLLNAALKKLNRATCQKSSKVTDEFLSFDVGVFGEKLSVDDCVKVESFINEIIGEQVAVATKEVDSEVLYGLDDVTLIPGEVYPECNVRLIEIFNKSGLVSREPCCGTHVYNTGDLEEFFITSFKSLGRSTTSLIAVTGTNAKLAKENGVKFSEEVARLRKNVDDNKDKPEILEEAVRSLKNQMKSDSLILPVSVKAKCTEHLNNIDKQIKQIAKGTLKEFIEMEMQNVLQTNQNRTKTNQEYVLHYLRCSMILENVPLQKATKMCPDVPVLVIAYADGMVKARCCVPVNLVRKDFDAEKWLDTCVAQVFKSTVGAPRGQDRSVVCNMKAKKVNLQDWDTLLNQSLEAAKVFIESHL